MIFINKNIYLILLSGIFLFSSCEKNKEIPNFVAKVDDELLSPHKLVTDIDSVSQKSKKKVNEYINQWVNQTMLYKEAQKKGILNSDKFLDALENAKKAIAINFLLSDEIYSKPLQISEDEIQDFYNLHKNEFLLGNDVIGISYMLFSDMKNAADFKNQVNPSSWKSVSERFRLQFSNVILKFENDVFYKYSELSPVEIWKNAVKLEANQISNPVKVLEGYVIIKLNSKQKAGETGSINYARNDIKERLSIEKKRKIYLDFLRELQTKYHPEIINEFQ